MADKELVAQKLKILLDKGVLCENYENAVADAIQLLENQTDIVRCKDCQYTLRSDIDRPLYVKCSISNTSNKYDWFCAYGVRKE